MGGRSNSTLYVGLTSDPVPRAWHYKQGAVEEFTRKWGVKMEDLYGVIPAWGGFSPSRE